MPLVSICIPAYHAENYMSEALFSVCNQSFTDWELIVVEDGSKDNTEKLVNEIADKIQQPVHFYRHEINRGLPSTRNSGIKVKETTNFESCSVLYHPSKTVFLSELNKEKEFVKPSTSKYSGREEIFSVEKTNVGRMSI